MANLHEIQGVTPPMPSENLESSSDEIFDDPLHTPLTTDHETGTWDDSGPIRGFALEKRYEPGNTIDLAGRFGQRRQGGRPSEVGGRPFR